MANWARYLVASFAGLAIGATGLWFGTSRGLIGGSIAAGPWQTSRNYGTSATDPLTRAIVARAGLLALPARETLYWTATTDSAGAPLDGNCTYSLSGTPLDARWWSVTIYDDEGYLMPNPVGRWSVNGAAIDTGSDGRWQVTIAPTRPDGEWLPSSAGQPFHLTLRMYNPGAAFQRGPAPAAAAMPAIVRQAC